VSKVTEYAIDTRKHSYTPGASTWTV